ncbi:hypothetical protein B0A54_18091 [Friedmanniomyces endolithicus]|uniref:Uncharacterized protein n=1 Tax=Friedmanniomyces endolithicus TaxID=329885 RepID=A0A4U0TLW7_9PEZI|nr:hypothetical protein B0A54_18091 [Friedmanniomyces endolithicus]
MLNSGRKRKAANIGIGVVSVRSAQSQGQRGRAVSLEELESTPLTAVEELAALKAQVNDLIAAIGQLSAKKRAQVSSNDKDVIVIKKDDVVAKDTIEEAPINKYYYNSEAPYIDIKTRTAKINLEKAIRLGNAKEYTRGSV